MNFSNHGLIIPDVSFYQDDNSTPLGINFETMKRAGAVGIIIRAGQNSWVDPDFATNWRAAKQAGLPRGSYFFYDSRSDPVSQAVLWKNTINGDLPELGLWMDFEESYGGPYKGERYWKVFAQSVAAEFPTVQVQGVYTAEWYWNQWEIHDPEYWSRFPLWVAQYETVQTLVVLPYPWRSRNKQAVFWQYTYKGDGPKYGVESYGIDLNYFNGTIEQFAATFRLTEPLPQPPGEPTMPYRYEASNLYPDMSLRDFHNTGGNRISKYPASTVWLGDTTWTAPADLFIGGVQVNKTGDEWLHVKSVGGVETDGWVAITHLGRIYCTVIDSGEPTEPEPPAEPELLVPDYLIAHYADGTEKRYIPE